MRGARAALARLDGGCGGNTLPAAANGVGGPKRAREHDLEEAMRPSRCLAATAAVAAGVALSAAAGAGAGTAVTPKKAAATPKLTPAQKKAGLAAWRKAGCGGCHTLAAGGGIGTRGPNLDAMWFPTADIVRQVTNGGSYMPAFKGILTKAQITAVSNWVRAVSKAKKPS